MIESTLEVKKATPNDVFKYLIEKKASLQSFLIHHDQQHEDASRRWSCTVTSEAPNDKQFCYSVVRFAPTMMTVCAAVIEALDEKEWS